MVERSVLIREAEETERFAAELESAGQLYNAREGYLAAADMFEVAEDTAGTARAIEKARKVSRLGTEREEY